MLKEVKIEKENKKMMAATLVVIRLRRRCILSENINVNIVTIKQIAGKMNMATIKKKTIRNKKCL